MGLEAKVALVTGASRGIGAAIAYRLASLGAKVVGTATTEEGAQNISEYLAPYGGVGKVLNVNQGEAISELIHTIEQDKGTIAILVNNAGITRDGLLMRMNEEDWDAVINTNLKSVFMTSKAVLRGMMRARYGRIINIASVVGCTGNPGQVNYSAAKSGMIGFSKSMAQEVGRRNITINCVAPGFIDTDMTKVLPEAQRLALIERTALGCFGEPNDIAAAVAFLASDEAKYITGQTLHVNGGLFMP